MKKELFRVSSFVRSLTCLHVSRMDGGENKRKLIKKPKTKKTKTKVRSNEMVISNQPTNYGQ